MTIEMVIKNESFKRGDLRTTVEATCQRAKDFEFKFTADAEYIIRMAGN